MDSSLASAALAAAFALQPPGDFHGNEPVARHGERWFAVQTAPGGRSALVSTTVSVRPAFDEVLDAPGERSGLSVKSPLPPGGTVVFLRGPALHAGPLATARVDTVHGTASPLDTVHTIGFAGRRFQVRTRCDRAPVRLVDGQAQRECDLVLEGGRHSRVLHKVWSYRNDIEGRQQWMAIDGTSVPFAGDLDRDGRLDLVLELSGGDSMMRRVLLLSSKAAGGALVAEVASFESTGC